MSAPDDRPGWSGGIERYEQLRAAAIVNGPAGFRLGLALLQRQGLAAWARAWDGAAGLGPDPRPASRLAPTRSDEIVATLAGMALACVGEGA